MHFQTVAQCLSVQPQLRELGEEEKGSHTGLGKDTFAKSL